MDVNKTVFPPRQGRLEDASHMLLLVSFLSHLQGSRFPRQRSPSDAGEDDLLIQGPRCDMDAFLPSLINCGGRCGGQADDVRGGLIASHCSPEDPWSHTSSSFRTSFLCISTAIKETQSGKLQALCHTFTFTRAGTIAPVGNVIKTPSSNYAQGL